MGMRQNFRSIFAPGFEFLHSNHTASLACTNVSMRLNLYHNHSSTIVQADNKLALHRSTIANHTTRTQNQENNIGWRQKTKVDTAKLGHWKRNLRQNYLLEDVYCVILK